MEWDINRSGIKVRSYYFRRDGCLNTEKRTINPQGGAIWCLAPNPALNILAIGCEDGTVRLLSVANDTLTHYRRFDRVKCRILSIAWGPPVPRRNGEKPTAATPEESSDEGDDEDDWNDSWLVTGGSDSSLRKWDATTGKMLDRMVTDKIRGERTLVWSVGALGSVICLLNKMVLFTVTISQRWNHNIWGLPWNGQILGLADMYATPVV